MISETVTIVNKLGLHARAASKFVEHASQFSSEITIVNQSTSANGKSIMKMMMLGAACGTEITLEIEGDDQQAAMQAMVDLIADKFGEET